ncbi:MAG TPA: hypothetical protein VK741_25835 [Acetobacteraceae bacterium]|nr:hypothetical protein [Acetobacteraceae bacterium]
MRVVKIAVSRRLALADGAAVYISAEADLGRADDRAACSRELQDAIDGDVAAWAERLGSDVRLATPPRRSMQ